MGGHDPEFLERYRYFFDACADDDFRFAEAARLMSQELTAKDVSHRTVVYPEGRHNDACWVPRLFRSNLVSNGVTLEGDIRDIALGTMSERKAPAGMIGRLMAAMKGGF